MPHDVTHPYRVAIYYAPDPASVWGQAGRHWLGRCAATHAVADQPVIESLAQDDLHRLTAEPRRYGWHATLKAPFELATACSLDDLHLAVSQFCVGRQPVDLPALSAQRMGDFLALKPLQPCPDLEQLASDCVKVFHAFAAPLSESERHRRRQATLTPEQDALLLRWGYPWVMNHFRFHLSLTGSLDGVDPNTVDIVLKKARAQFEELPRVTIDRLSIFIEPTRGADFLLHKQVVFQP